jgi:hypothetical protein
MVEENASSTRSGDEDFVHPMALGIERTGHSRFAWHTAAGTLSTLRVLLWDGDRGSESNLEDLARTHRPDVFCPFCGRKGQYASTEKRLYFRHASGNEHCVGGDLESVLHKRAKACLVDGLQHARRQGLPLVWARACVDCGHEEEEELVAVGGWSSEREEVSFHAGDRRVQFDAAAHGDDQVVVGLEVRHRHPCPPEKLEAVAATGVPLVEVAARALFDEQGSSAWDGTTPLPVSRVWRVRGRPCPWTCPPCVAARRAAEDSDKTALLAVARRIAHLGLFVGCPCVRCGQFSPTKALGAGLVQVSAEEGLVALQAPGRCLTLGWRSPQGNGLHFSLSPETARELARSRGRLVVGPTTLALWSGPATPVVCDGCRRPSQRARDIQELWNRAESRGGLHDAFKRTVEQEWGLPLGCLDSQRAEFACRMEVRPEDFRDDPNLGRPAWSGTPATVNGIQVLERLLNIKLAGTWRSLEELLPSPHQLLAKRLAEGVAVDASALGGAEVLLTELGLREEAAIWRGRARVLEALVDHQGGGHTAWARGVNSLAGRVRGRLRRCGADVPWSVCRDWVDEAIQAKLVARLDRLGSRDLAIRSEAVRSWELSREARRRALLAWPELDGVHTGIRLDPCQEDAVRLAAKSGLSIIHGGAGTGKTTVVRSLLETLGEEARAIVVAPTGKAAARIGESLSGLPQVGRASTVDRLLGVPALLVNADTLVVDEAGFLCLEKAARLFGLLKTPAGRPVGAGSVLADLLAARENGEPVVPQAELTTGFRSQSTISEFAASVLDRRPRIDLVRHLDVPNARIASAIVDDCRASGSLHGRQIIAAKKDTVHEINLAMQKAWNPRGSAFGPRGLRDGDRVLRLRNRHEAPRIMNGEVGTLRLVDRESRFVVDNGGCVRGPFEWEELGHFDLAYAMTVHKSQGSEWDTVYVAVPSDEGRFFDQRMLYTACTRARTELVLVGPAQAIHKAAETTKKRITLLRTMLEAR